MAGFKYKDVAKRRFGSILFWAVISAAFIGPGTVTTCTKAGAQFDFDLMWSMVFSTLACILLQEAAARVRIHSGLNLGEAISKHFENKSSRVLIMILVVGAIIFGSAAYEAGNILGSIEGLMFFIPNFPKKILVVIIGILAFLALSFKSMSSVAKFMGWIVIFMGLAFISTAIFLKPSFSDLISGSFIPTIPKMPGAGILVLGIIGTTVVPYDLFLGSGVIVNKQSISDMRFGLFVAIGMGGIISMSIITVGAAITEGMPPEARADIIANFSFKQVSDILVLYIGEWAVFIFGLGMFAAGFSSAITAPLASSITARSIFKANNKKWIDNNLYFRLVSTGVLLVGLTFGFMEVKPIPVIIVVQALNGLILPFVSVFLVFVINNPFLMGKDKINGHISNILMSFVVWITTIIGSINIFKAIVSATKIENIDSDFVFTIISALALLFTIFLFAKIYKKRKRDIKVLNLEADEII